MVERRAGILEYIQSKGEASTDELFRLYPGKTPKTIRRDLVYLEQAGAILRSHGKARVNKQYLLQPETHYSEREGENMPAKLAMAKMAAGLLEGRRSVFLDSGTTMMAAEQTKRTAYLMELDPRYADCIVSRFAKMNNSYRDIYLLRNDEKTPFSQVSET